MKRNPQNTMWETPKPILKEILKQFNLKNNFVDIAATKKNRKFRRYIDKKTNALKQKLMHNSFCNPPFNDLATWVEFCHRQHQKYGITVLMLLPCYTDSSWWTEHIGNKFQYVSDFQFLDKRLGFLINNKPALDKNGKRQVYYMPCVWILWRGSK